MILYSKPIEREETMDNIACNTGMEKEMVELLMSGKKGAITMYDQQKNILENRSSTIKILPAVKRNNLAIYTAMVN